ncbi:MAG: NAD(P)/FAD-dependent oxidoreductase [Spirochaetes bacterium]|nr:NAD(P)/FAD-dependent oxidoreductase [Spirochaetota bacterium]
MAHYNIAIVGGGPGGSYAAKTAAENGLKAIFFERGKVPGDKNASGCGLGQRWWRDFPAMMDKISLLPSFREITHCAFVITDVDDRHITTIVTGRNARPEGRIMYKGKGRAWTGASIYRSDLDKFLADTACAAGAELRTSTLVTDLIMENGQVKGVITDKGEKITADVVIGADGAHSMVAIKSGIRKRWKKNEVTLVPQVDFSCNESKMDDIIGAAEWVWFGPYCGAYQVNFRDGFHLGAGQWLDIYNEKPVELLKKVLKIPQFQKMCRSVDAELREFQVHLLPWMPQPGTKTYGNGVILIGDAGGFPCPLEGEGVWHACWTGKIAVETIATALSKGDVSAKGLGDYERRWKDSPVGREFEYGHEFVNFWRNSAFDPEFMKKIVVLLGELQTLNGPSIVFDWSDDHMTTINEHLGYFLDALADPQVRAFGRNYLTPMGRGITRENMEKIASMLAPAIASKIKILPEKMIRNMLVKKLCKNRVSGVDRLAN